MSDKVTSSHLARLAYVYLRQSTPSQVAQNRESTARQYGLVERAVQLGWPRERVRLVDEDLGITGSGTADRNGFDRMSADVAMGQVGLILALESSRVARNNTEWHRLIEFCAVCDTLIGDEDGIYHPSMPNDRLLLGLKGTMSEAELHTIRARLLGGIRSKATRGELRYGLPIGLVWGEADGEILLDPDEAVRNAVRTVFEKFPELGSVRQVWVWFRSESALLPSRPRQGADVRWAAPTYHGLYAILTNPLYAGAYHFGRTRQEAYIDKNGRVRKKVRYLPRSEWRVFIKDHHAGYIDWDTFEMNQSRLKRNARARAGQPGGAIREGAALLQGLATCGHCGRRLRVAYQGDNSTPAYHCVDTTAAGDRTVYCLRIGGVHVDRAVADAFLNAIQPASVQAAIEAERQLEADHDAAAEHWRLQVERAQYEADKAARRYRSVEPEHRLVARGLESEWEKRLRELSAAKAELEERLRRRPRELTAAERERLHDLSGDLATVWHAPTTSDRDRKELLQLLLEEVAISVDREAATAHLMLRWRGGTITELDVGIRSARSRRRTDEDTIELVRRMAPHYSNAVIAGILNRQGRRTAYGHRFSASAVSNLRRQWKLPRWEPPPQQVEGDLMTVRDAAKVLGVVPSTIFRHIKDGYIIGEQITPGAPWRLRVTSEVRARYVEAAPEGYLPVKEAMRVLGVSRQTLWQRVKRGQLQSVYVSRGRRKGLCVQVLDEQLPLFEGMQ
jgi:DNA invertase Pin-like site-specific DNA recombinase